jgi:hypothetical protein
MFLRRTLAKRNSKVAITPMPSRIYPTYAVIDRKGIVRAIGLQPQHVETVVQKLLAEPAP